MNQNEVISVNVEHVRSLLGDEHLRRLIERLRKRMSRGEALTGRIQLCGATPDERAAIDKLMGRLPTRGSSLTVDLDQLAQVMVRANACARLEEAVVAITGPVTNRRAESLSRKQRWERFWQTFRNQIEGNPTALRWMDDLKASGVLKRSAAGDLDVANLLLNQAVAIVRQVPLSGVRLAELAATATGDSHALDRGRPLAALVIRYARSLHTFARWQTAAERRDAWEVLGVLCDELSAPVLVLNLRADNDSLTGRALNLHADAGEPYRISVRQLRRHPPVFDPQTCSEEVFVCENPTVVDVAANRHGKSCRPLICLDGQPKTASRLLLDALTNAGIQIRYHGDFDWDGIRIANTIMQRHGAGSWRFNKADYADASEKDHHLKGTPVIAEWDDELAELMAEVGKCVHEENVLDTLLIDLRRDS